MKKLFFLFTLVFFISFSSNSQGLLDLAKKAQQVLPVGGLSEDEVVKGLKEALVKGTNSGTSTASKLDGFLGNPSIKIPFPPEVKQVEDKLRSLGMNKLVDDFIVSLNRGAEQAADEAKPIFVSAITGMTVKDGFDILKGADDAATRYLEKTTTAGLTSAFQPVIKKALDATNATKYWAQIITAYNKIPFIADVNPNLDEYATEKAITGLFFLIAIQEKLIREDPLARTSELLKKVFGNNNK
ncbi:MAG: hypothetical protein COB85_07160 [Bacteroidetes bacterium]|nr:MAG: hypothetical protein COB85_07160 [Bacteroidota bacterium]